VKSAPAPSLVPTENKTIRVVVFLVLFVCTEYVDIFVITQGEVVDIKVPNERWALGFVCTWLISLFPRMEPAYSALQTWSPQKYQMSASGCEIDLHCPLDLII
jgi:hypothetical protein